MCFRLARAYIKTPKHLLGAHDFAVGVNVLSGSADHVLLADTPCLFSEYAHEVLAATGKHEHPELVRSDSAAERRWSRK
jgi:hypothetical protein